MIDASAFNFDAMKQAVGIDPFAQETNKYGKDERFYVLSKDKNGNGAALIRFLPDSERSMIQKLFKVNTPLPKTTKSVLFPSSLLLLSDNHARSKKNGNACGTLVTKRVLNFLVVVSALSLTSRSSRIRQTPKTKVKSSFTKCPAP